MEAAFKRSWTRARAGYFPIALNIYTVVGITAYYSTLNALSYYCVSWSHYKVRPPACPRPRHAGRSLRSHGRHSP